MSRPMTPTTKRRFAKSLEFAIQEMIRDAKSFCYYNDEEFQKVIRGLRITQKELIKEYKEHERLLREENEKLLAEAKNEGRI